MSALPRFAPAPDDVALVLLGNGVVGGALLHLLASDAARGVRLVGVANSSRQIADVRGIDPSSASEVLSDAPPRRSDEELLATLEACNTPRRIVVDATASAETAAKHAHWLAAGCDVVTANKDAAAGSVHASTALRAAGQRTSTNYGDSATVGAGLPVLSTLRRLRDCGDRVLSLEGVFSGSLSWLFNQFDGTRPFSALLREARAWGYTEPDPRVDLGGVDVARKLVILARAAGYAIELRDVEVESLVPEALRTLDTEAFLRRAGEIDAAIEARFVEAQAEDCVLRHLAALDAHGRARVGLAKVSREHPAARLGGTDNLFALMTERYRARPLVIQGPGAGAEVTAQALLADVLSVRSASFR